MKHETHSKRLTRYLQNYSGHARKRLKESKRGFDWGSLDSPKEFATSTFIDGFLPLLVLLVALATAILTVCVIILMSEQI